MTPRAALRIDFSSCLLAAICAFTSGCGLFTRVPEARYEVLDRLGDAGVELRRYPAEVWAVTEVEAAFKDAGNKGFRPLFRYISGDNSAGAKISMTTPVSQTAGVSIPMTAPVAQSATAAGRFEIGFLVPPDWPSDKIPEPTDPAVRLKRRDARLMAVLRFSGWGRPSEVEAKEKELLMAVAEHGLRPVGSVVYARFNPPITPGFWRRNEVQVEIQETK